MIAAVEEIRGQYQMERKEIMLSHAVMQEIARCLTVGKKQFDIIDKSEASVLEVFLERLKIKGIDKPDITFVQRRDHDRVDIVIGLAADTLTSAVAAAAQLTARELMESLPEVTVRIELGRIPKDGEFLFFDAFQAMFIATEYPLTNRMQFNNIGLAFEAAMTLKNTPYRSPSEIFRIFALYAMRCFEAGLRRRSTACVEQCEKILELVVEAGGLPQDPDGSEYEMILFIGQMYENLDVPDRSIDIALKYVQTVKKESEKYLLKQRIADWVEKRESQEEANEEIKDVVRRVSAIWNREQRLA